MFPYRDEIVLQLTRKLVASHRMAATKYIQGQVQGW